ncbi:MAG: cytochrome P450 [Pseudonocardiaceae bacterium]
MREPVDELIDGFPAGGTVEFIPITGRVAIEDLEVDGVAIPAGTRLSMLLATGNTDPAAFGADPDGFDITVRRPASLTFGAGIHYCLGATLARAEMAEALPILARRLGPIEPDREPVWRPTLGITGPVTLPIRFTLGGAVLTADEVSVAELIT